jgi:twinkle protein
LNDIIRLKQMLADRAHEVAAMLLPGGRKEGAEWRAGSITGERGQSLGVHLSGAKAGVWSDFSTGESGDMIDLWVAAKHVPLTTALDDIRAYLGVQRPQEPYRDPRPNYTRPPRPQCHAPQARVLDYLKEERNIPREVMARYKIGEDGIRIIFPFLLPDGTLAMAKAREATAGAKPIPTAANCEPVLFGWQAIGENERRLVITEGEIDALSMAAYGQPAMSVPFGGGGKGKQNWIENEFDRLQRFDRIYLATDMDEQGELAAAEIASRLGRHRCYRVTLPRKDANECLVEGVTRDEIETSIANAAALDPEGLRRAASFEDKIVKLFYPPQGAPEGYSVPYTGLHGKLLFRPAEVTLWSGDTGSGKSQVISDCTPKWIEQGSRICLASLEMKPEQSLKRMIKQAGGIDRPTQHFLREILTWLDRGLLLYDRVGKASIEGLLEIFDYARAKYGCDQFVIDSFMRLGIPGDDYNAQEAAIFKLVNWAVESNVHLHLVAHSRKPGKERGVPDSADVKGAMEIGANAFNIVTVFRNRKIEEMAAAANNGEPPDMTDEPGVTLNVAKQRNGDFEGKVNFFFNRRTYQYYSVSDNRRFPRCYVELGEGPTVANESHHETAETA